MNQQKQSSGPVGGLIKGAGFVIGLATEFHAHNKAKKPSSQSLTQPLQPKSARQDGACSGSDSGLPTYDDVMSFERPLDLNRGDSKSPVPDNKLTYVHDLATIQQLPYPVILPQRRPNDKSRGFVRAYAPDLGKYKGIDEVTFLNFLKQFHKSSQASGWFQVINIAALGAGFAPSAIAMAVSTSVQVASRVASEAQSRYRTNAYLEKANDELFHPKNLHCMIMTFKPEASGTAVLDFGVSGGSSPGPTTPLSRLMSSSSKISGGAGTGGGRFRTSDGVTEGELALPEVAHLVYSTTIPGETSENANEEGDIQRKKESSWKSTGKFLADYQDRRAQAKFAAAYGQDSKLAIPGAMDAGRFASRFSDPNANLFAFGSGAGQRRSISRDRSPSRREDHDDRSRASSSPGLVGGMKKMMQQDVLYLLIAEIPTEAEMAKILS